MLFKETHTNLLACFGAVGRGLAKCADLAIVIITNGASWRSHVFSLDINPKLWLLVVIALMRRT
jgi:hypothetical protein